MVRVVAPARVASCATLFETLARIASARWLLYTGIALLMLLPGLLIGPSLDAAVFSAVGWRMSEGDLLYTQIWDHKPPGLFIPSALVHSLVSASSSAWPLTWAVTLVCCVATAAVVDRTLRARGIDWPATMAAGLAALVLGSYLLTLGGGLGESYAVLPAAMALAFVATPGTRGSRWYWAGLLAGVAAAISVQAITVGAAIALLSLRGGIRRSVMRIGLAFGGFASVALITIGWLAVSGALPAAADALIDYNTAYRAAGRDPGVGSEGSFLLPWIFLSLLPLVVPAAMAIISRRRIGPHGELLLASVAWMAAGILAVLVQGRLYGHYVLPLVVPLALVAGVGLDGMMPRRNNFRRLLMILAPIGLATVLSLAVGAVGASMEQRWIRESNEHVAAVAPVIRETSPPGSSILVWGNEPRLYEASQRDPALRYVYLYPLLTAKYVTTDLVEQLAEQLETSPPALIIDAGSPAPGEPGLPPLLIDRPVATDGRAHDVLDPLRQIVADSYEQRAIVSGWVIYGLRTP